MQPKVIGVHSVNMFESPLGILNISEETKEKEWNSGRGSWDSNLTLHSLTFVPGKMIVLKMVRDTIQYGLTVRESVISQTGVQVGSKVVNSVGQ